MFTGRFITVWRAIVEMLHTVSCSKDIHGETQYSEASYRCHRDTQYSKARP